MRNKEEKGCTNSPKMTKDEYIERLEEMLGEKKEQFKEMIKSIAQAQAKIELLEEKYTRKKGFTNLDEDGVPYPGLQLRDWKEGEFESWLIKNFAWQIKRELIERYSTKPNLKIDIRDWNFIDKLVEKYAQ